MTSNRTSSVERGQHVSLTFDLDAVSLWTTTFRAFSPSAVSRGEFGPDVGLPRILAMLARQEVPATFFIPGMVAELYPDAIRAIRDGGHELATHGDLHERHAKLERDEERAVIERGIAKLHAVTGELPTGFRAPGWEISAHTIELLLEQGLTYDSSQFGSDYIPYRARTNDQAALGEWQPGLPSAIWEFPIAWELDDVPYFLTQPPGFFGTTAPSTVLDIWTGELEYMARETADGVLTLTMHPQVIGRGPRVEMLSRFIDSAKALDLTFSTLNTTTEIWSSHDRHAH